MLTIGIVLFVGAGEAEAAPAFAVHLRYAAPATCPSEANFVAALRLDTDPFELTSERDAQRVVDVELDVLASSARGRFRLVDVGHGTTIQRELTGPDCEAVARALAVMVALTMQRLSDPPEPTPPRDPVPAPLPTPRDVPPAPKREAPIARAAVPPERRVRFYADLEGGLTTAVVNDALAFVALSLEIEPRVPRLHPALAVSVRQSLSKEIAVGGGEASFLWTAGALRLCPHVVALATFDLAPCLEASLGRLHADAKGLPAPRSSTDLWADGSLLLAARWHFTSRGYLTTSASATAAFTRSRFSLSSGALISETPAVGIGVGLGIGLAF